MLSPGKEKSICFLGDILIYSHLGPNSEEVISLLNKVDIVFGNLETTLATKGYPAAKVFTLRAETSIVKDFIKMNVKALALANNHGMDFGFEGIFETMKTLDDHNIAYAGAGRDLTEALKPTILRLGDLRIAFLSCSSQVTSDSIATENRPGMAPLRVDTHINVIARSQQEYVGWPPEIIMKAEESDLKALLMAVENTRKKADFVVVSIHWGPQWQPMVLDYQSEIAHTLIDHGVDIIMGHGPHVLQGIEVYKKRYVFYSLGHFVFHTNQPRMTTMLPEMPNNIPMKRAVADPVRWRLNETAIGKVVLSDSEIKRVEIIPVILDRNGSPQVCDNDAAMSILNDLAVFSRYLDTRVTIKENKGIIEV